MSFVGLITTLFNMFLYLLLGVVVLGCFIYRRLHNSINEDAVSGYVEATCEGECDENEDSSAHCLYGFSAKHQHCPNCDLAEQCLGISFRDDDE